MSTTASLRRRLGLVLLAVAAPGLAACQTTGGGGGGRLPPLTISSPQALMGEGPQALTATLGAPALLRKETPAQVWQYRGQGCVLDFFLYDDAGGPRITHIEARARKGGATDPGHCLRDVHRSHDRGPSLAV